MEIKYIKKDKVLTIFVYGELDECSSSTAKEVLDKVVIENLDCKKVIFNLSGLSFMDSTGIGLLIGRYKKIKNFSVPSYITGAPNEIEKVLQLSGIYNIMPKI